MDTFQEASDFIWKELKDMKKFNFTYSTIKKNGTTITSFELKDHNIVYTIRNQISSLEKNIFKIGLNLLGNNQKEKTCTG